jgi:hypothetical protein
MYVYVGVELDIADRWRIPGHDHRMVLTGVAKPYIIRNICMVASCDGLMVHGNTKVKALKVAKKSSIKIP